MQQNDDLPEDQQEDETDLNLRHDWFRGATLWSTDWTTETVINQLKRGNINLNPRYQRRNAWTPARKSQFLESIILGLPIPQIILAQEKGKVGRFMVIDGKQRLLSIRQFASEQDDGDFQQLKLVGLRDRDDLNGITYNDLQQDLNFRDDLDSFDNQTIRTVVIRDWKDEKYLYSVFLRINTGSVQLSPQELRQALKPGPFSDYIDDFSSASKPLQDLLSLTQPDFRMRDVELVLRYFSYKNRISEYRGDLKKFLDETTEYFNKNWEDGQGRIKMQSDEFEFSLHVAEMIFGRRGRLRKWNGREYEKRVNRAVFDIMTFFFSSQEIGERSLGYAVRIKERFQILCSSNEEFRNSLESTTKSMEANRTRFKTWALNLSEILEMNIESPI